MTRDVIVAMARALPHDVLGQLVAGLPDEQLVDIARAALARLVATAPTKPTAALRRERARRAAPAAGGDSAAMVAVAKALQAADGALAVSEIVDKTDLPYGTVRYALVRLRAQRRAFNAGRTTSSRWAVTQAAADEAVA